MSSTKQTMATPTAGQSSGISKNFFILTIAIVAVISFVAGTRGSEILGAVAPALGLKIETGTLDLSR